MKHCGKTLEKHDQILQTVETIGKLKRALDSQINALEQHVSVGQKERNKMMKSWLA